MNSFTLGEVYFQVTYPDPDFLYPGIESFVYLGKNLSDEDVEDTWYFQPAGDYGRYGSALDPGASEQPVVCVNQSDATEMLDLPRLVSALQAAMTRRAMKPA